MKVNLFGLTISIERTRRSLSSLTQADVDQLAVSYNGFATGGTSRTIARIKAIRTLRPDAGLKEAKELAEQWPH